MAHQPNIDRTTTPPKKNKDWTTPVNGAIDVPDALMPLFNKVGMQMKFYRLSGKNEVVTIADIVELSRRFFKENPSALECDA